VQVAVLVDKSGKVLDASGLAEAAALAKSLTLPLIEWPEHQLPSVRTVEFKAGEDRGSVRRFI
jgi:hypothetical protein